jgi:hypothetical protein
MSEKSLAFIGNASADESLSEDVPVRAEAFSIRRLEGSRWRLQRTRQLWKLNASLVLSYQNNLRSASRDPGFAHRIHRHDATATTRSGQCGHPCVYPTNAHAKRPPRQRLRSSRPYGSWAPTLRHWISPAWSPTVY